MRDSFGSEILPFRFVSVSVSAGSWTDEQNTQSHFLTHFILFRSISFFVAVLVRLPRPALVTCFLIVSLTSVFVGIETLREGAAGVVARADLEGK